MLRHELEEYLHTFLNVALIKDYCPNGLQVEGKNEIKKIGVAVSANLMTFQLAVEHSLDALIVHHGLFWDKDPYPIVGSKKSKIHLLLENQVSLFAYHLPLDAHREVGNNWKAAQDLGWEGLEPFGEFNGTLIGVKGSFAQEPIAAFIQKVEAYYGHAATVALGGEKNISSAALISGGAYKELLKASEAGVDCFVTGNFDEPAWGVAYEERIHFLALGHSATETVGPKALAAHLQDKFKIESIFLDVPNPF